MTHIGLVVTAFAGYVAYRIGKAIVEENRASPRATPEKVHKAPPPEIGVDVSAKV